MQLKRYLFVGICVCMLFLSGTANALPQAPALSVTNRGWMYLSWAEVDGATGFYSILCLNALYGSRIHRELGYGNANKLVG